LNYRRLVLRGNRSIGPQVGPVGPQLDRSTKSVGQPVHQDDCCCGGWI